MSDIFYEDNLYDNIDSYLDDYDAFDISESFMDTDDEWNNYEEYMEEYDDYEDIYEERSRSRQKTSGNKKTSSNAPKKKWTKKKIIKTAIATIAVIGALILVLKKVRSSAKKEEAKPTKTQTQQVKRSTPQSQPPRRDPEPEKKPKRTLKVKKTSSEVGGSKWYKSSDIDRRMDQYLQGREDIVKGFDMKKAEYKKAANRKFQNSKYAANRHGYLESWNPNDPIGSCDRMIKNLENHKTNIKSDMKKLEKLKGGKNKKNRDARKKYDNAEKSLGYYDETKEEILLMKHVLSIAKEVDHYKSEVAKAANKMRVPIPKSIL